MTTHDHSEQLIHRVREALASGTVLDIRGGDSKRFYGRTPVGESLSVAEHRGIVAYEPTELVVTARAGTPLAELEAALAEQNQMLPFEPPDFDGAATLGGAVSSGLSGPRRPWVGAARDLVLGLRLINGKAEHMRFGGQVMKNVAGYDVSRVVTGAMGTLGVVTELSVKVLPRPQASETRVLELDAQQAMEQVETWFRHGLPVTGAAHDGQRLHLRLEGASSAVNAGVEAAGGEPEEEAGAWWSGLRHQRLPWFQAGDTPLWRLSLPPLAPVLDLPGDTFTDWNGQLRWLRTDADAETIRRACEQLGGHATLFRGGDREGDVFHPQSPALVTLQRRLKNAFDPEGIFNPGRLLREF
ncbi:MAG: glycolate oxidase subunit GlcE [Ectothiorhodospiraceae bacterium]|nr:glycolate oxidase subunit GlcE [Ectothiorhodospiraceae bacterium]MCH8502883.1 glycolate oxidase subunit GlcE [Ectothiorhodospiraceae bacterium]